MTQDWNSPPYSFYLPTPRIEVKDGRRAHLFECFNKGCRSRFVRRYVNETSTGNLGRHAKKCGGEAFVDILIAVDDSGKRKEMAEKYARDGTITVAVERTGKGTVTYSSRMLTKEESRYAHTKYVLCLSFSPLFIHLSKFHALTTLNIISIVRRIEAVKWCASSTRPFAILSDPGLHVFVKSGRPGAYIPHPTTISRNTKVVWAKVQKHIAKMLQVRRSHFRLCKLSDLRLST